MTLDELKDTLRELKKLEEEDRDPETLHYKADEALLEYIGDEDVDRLYTNLTRWYS